MILIMKITSLFHCPTSSPNMFPNPSLIALDLSCNQCFYLCAKNDANQQVKIIAQSIIMKSLYAENLVVVWTHFLLPSPNKPLNGQGPMCFKLKCNNRSGGGGEKSL